MTETLDTTTAGHDPAPTTARPAELPNSPPIPQMRDPVPAPGTRADFLRALPTFAADGFTLQGKRDDDRLALWFGKWDVEASDDDDLRSLQSLHQRSIDEYRGMVETITAVYSDDDPSLNGAGRLKIAGSTIEPRIQALASVAATELERVDERIAKEEAALQAGYRASDPAQALLHDSIRRHVKDNGLDVLALARGEMDTETLQAIAGAPGYLSGLDREQHERVCRALAERTHPDKVQTIGQLRKAKQRAMRALDALDRKSRKFVDFKRAREIAGKGA